MQISIEEAASQLSTLVLQVQQGEDVVLLQDGEPSVRLVPAPARRPAPAAQGIEDVRSSIEAVQRQAAHKLAATPRPQKTRDPKALEAMFQRIAKAAPPPSGDPAGSAARSQDFLYDEDGLPA